MVLESDALSTKPFPVPVEFVEAIPKPALDVKPGESEEEAVFGKENEDDDVDDDSVDEDRIGPVW